MKRLLTALALIMVLCVPAHALTDAEYIRLKRSPEFTQADRELTKAYNDAKDSMRASDFEKLRDEQREWIDYGRDEHARSLMRNDDYSRIEAYTEATRARTREIRKAIADSPRPRTRPRPRPEPQTVDYSGYFNKGKDVYMSVQYINKADKFMGVRLRYRDEEWFGRGRLHGKELTASSGNKSVTLYFVNNNTINVETNEAFNRAMGFDAEGRYRRNNGN